MTIKSISFDDIATRSERHFTASHICRIGVCVPEVELLPLISRSAFQRKAKGPMSAFIVPRGNSPVDIKRISLVDGKVISIMIPGARMHIPRIPTVYLKILTWPRRDVIVFHEGAVRAPRIPNNITNSILIPSLPRLVIAPMNALQLVSRICAPDSLRPSAFELDFFKRRAIIEDSHI